MSYKKGKDGKIKNMWWLSRTSNRGIEIIGNHININKHTEINGIGVEINDFEPDDMQFCKIKEIYNFDNESL